MPAEHYTLVLTFCFSLLTSSWSSDSVIYCPRNKLFIFLREQSSLLHTGKNGDKVLWSLIAGWKASLKMSLSVASDRLARQCSSALLFKTKSDIVEGTKMCLRTKFTKPASLAIRAPVELIPTTKIGLLWIIYTWSVVSWRFGNMGKKNNIK